MCVRIVLYQTVCDVKVPTNRLNHNYYIIRIYIILASFKHIFECYHQQKLIIIIVNSGTRTTE